MVKSAKKPKKESPTPLLQKWQRNKIFEAIQTVGLDPGNFDLNDSGTEVRIKHRSSASCFTVRRESGYYVGQRVVGDGPVWPYSPCSWESLMPRVSMWLEEVKRDLDAPRSVQQSVAPKSFLVQGFGPRGPSNDQILIAAQAAVPEPGEVFRDCPDCAEMVVVPPGAFDMGSRDTPFESPPHRVTIAAPYAIARRETTFSEWDACVADGGCTYKPDDHGWGRGNQPVIDVSWQDAKSFTVWLARKTGRNYRLPSEAEWEYAARAGTTSKFWWGKDIGKSNANCDGCGEVSLHKTTPTGSFRPNGFGLYDTSGNAYEWVADCWNDSYAKAPKDGSAWISGQCSQRVLRGGSFANNFNAATSAARFRYDLDVRYYANGFRVVRDLQ